VIKAPEIAENKTEKKACMKKGDISPVKACQGGQISGEEQAQLTGDKNHNGKKKTTRTSQARPGKSKKRQ